MSVHRLVERIRSERHELSPSTRRAVVLAAITTAILVTEGLLYLGAFGPVLWGYLFMFVAFTLAPLVTERTATADVFRAFTLVPLFRLLNLGLPVFVVTTLAWLPLVYGPMLLAAYILQDDLPAVDLPTGRDAWTTLLFLPFVLVGAIPLASLEYAIIDPAPLVESLELDHFFLVVFIMVVFVGFVEELVFRGILQRTLEAYAGRIAGIVLSSLVFGAMHAGLQLPGEVGFGIGIGLLFAVLYDWTDNLVIVVLLHGVLNVLLFAVFPIFGPVFVL